MGRECARVKAWEKLAALWMLVEAVAGTTTAAWAAMLSHDGRGRGSTQRGGVREWAPLSVTPKVAVPLEGACTHSAARAGCENRVTARTKLGIQDCLLR